MLDIFSTTIEAVMNLPILAVSDHEDSANVRDIALGDWSPAYGDSL